jgi:hypothetical protein
MVEVQEVDDVDRPHASGLRLSDPILLGPEDDLENSDNLEGIVHKFTQDWFSNGPNFKKEEFKASVPAMLPPEQVNDLNDVLFAIYEDLAGKAKAEGHLSKEDLPHLREEWKQSCQDILNGVPNKLPPLQEINHHIPLVDIEEKYNYYLPKSS